MAPLPQVDFPTILVTAQLPGASPEIMASSVAQPLETQFAQIPGVSQMTSSSVLGATQITLQFDLDRNIDAAAGDVQAAINAAGGQLPKNLPSPPSYRKVNPADYSILIFAVHSDVLPMTEVDDYAETVIAQQLSQLPGIAQVGVGGQQKPAVRVQVDPVKLAAVGLQLEDVANLITTATVDTPQGAITGAQRELHHLRQRPAAEGRAVERRDRRLQQRRADPHPRHRRWRSTVRRTPRSRGLPERPARECCCSSTSSPAAT